MNNIFFIIIALTVIAYIIVSVRNGRLSAKTSFGWMLVSVVMLILAIFPKSLDWFAITLGVEYPPALLLTLCVVLLFIINFGHSKKIADLQAKVIDLAEQLSILKGDKNDKK